MSTNLYIFLDIIRSCLVVPFGCFTFVSLFYFDYVVTFISCALTVILCVLSPLFDYYYFNEEKKYERNR